MLIASIYGAKASDLVTPLNLWRSWSAEPAVIGLLAVAAILYARGAYVARRASDGRAFSNHTIALFCAGWMSLAIALVSPLDRLGETLFAAHMAQHLMLIVVAAPLCVLGAPPTIWLWAIPHRERIAVGRRWSRSDSVRALMSIVQNPLVVLLAHTAALWFWHFPRPYQAAIANPAIHALEHTTFFGTAALFWWVVLHPAGRRTLGFGSSILYIGFTLCQSGALGALLMFSARAWYQVHTDGERLWGMTPLGDQQLAGLIMWIPAGAVYVAAAAVLFVQWMRADERVVHASERVPVAASR
jgi:putative membrane protein